MRPAARLSASAALALSLAAAGPARAGEAEAGFRFLERPAGARQAAMGGAAVALADDANAVLWNPAGLADARQRELSLGYQKPLSDMTAGTISYVHPFSSGGLGLAAFSQDSGKIQGYAPGDVKAEDFSVKDSFFSAAWGRAVTGSLRLGLGVKQASESIAGFSGSAMGFDAGATIRTPAPEGWACDASLALRNQGGKATFVSGKTPMPASIDAGVAVRGFSDALRLALETHRPSHGDVRHRIGAELWLQNVLALRAGFQTGDLIGAGLTLGAGFRTTTMLQIDYAYTPEGGFGASHHVGIILRFGGAGERAYQEGMRLAQKGEYAQAILKFEAALDADPKNAGAVRGLRDATRRLGEQMGRELNDAKGAK
jgi:hypothetical protein